jgi:hypothetical protein
LPAMALAVDGIVPVGGSFGGADDFDCVVEGRLIGFDLGDQGIAGVSCGLKCFFDSGSRRQ